MLRWHPHKCRLGCGWVRSQCSKPGRVVMTHSTHCEGLLPLLQRLAQEAGINTIVPGARTAVSCALGANQVRDAGRVAVARARAERLRLHVSTAVAGGHKVIARRGQCVQEVFIRTKLDAHELSSLITKHVIDS